MTRRKQTLRMSSLATNRFASPNSGRYAQERLLQRLRSQVLLEAMRCSRGLLSASSLWHGMSAQCTCIPGSLPLSNATWPLSSASRLWTSTAKISRALTPFSAGLSSLLSGSLLCLDLASWREESLNALAILLSNTQRLSWSSTRRTARLWYA